MFTALVKAHAKEVVAKCSHTGREKPLLVCGLLLLLYWETLSVLISTLRLQSEFSALCKLRSQLVINKYLPYTSFPPG